MQAAFDEYRGTLEPPSSAHAETLADVERGMAAGGAVLAWDGDQAVGSARFSLRPEHVYVGRVSVLPSHRRRGVASAMMRYLEDLGRQTGRACVEISVRQSLPSNVRLYESLGYTLYAVDPHPRGPDMNVVHLRKWL
jgi:ribosomal protein S18 acetylase RimI-like enzyme